MQNKELVSKIEFLKSSTSDVESADVNLASELMQAVEDRLATLEMIKEKVSSKFYQEVEAKLQRQKVLIEKLLNLKRQKQQFLSKFSFILDQHYFEQKLL